MNEFYGKYIASNIRLKKKELCGKYSPSYKEVDLLPLKKLIDSNPNRTIKTHIMNLGISLSYPTILNKFYEQFNTKLGEYRKKIIHENRIN